jgi:imidazoleglycerol-phosphate dehydratase
MERTAKVERTTNETKITLSLNLDGNGKSQINSGIGFFDQMFEGLAKHSFIDIELLAEGDLQVDGHHTIEDIGIVFGQALREALADKTGIRRFGQFMLPMDDALALCALDLGGRPYLDFDASFKSERVGYLESDLIREFFYAVTYAAGMNLHIKVLSGHNDHHMIEAIFKAFAKALSEAVMLDPRVVGVLSTKGSL